MKQTTLIHMLFPQNMIQFLEGEETFNWETANTIKKICSSQNMYILLEGVRFSQICFGKQAYAAPVHTYLCTHRQNCSTAMDRFPGRDIRWKSRNLIIPLVFQAYRFEPAPLFRSCTALIKRHERVQRHGVQMMKKWWNSYRAVPLILSVSDSSQFSFTAPVWIGKTVFKPKRNTMSPSFF